jgi:hypothetical protein
VPTRAQFRFNRVARRLQIAHYVHRKFLLTHCLAMLEPFIPR